MADGAGVVGLKSVPQEPVAGTPFHLVVELAARTTTDVLVALEKQRIVEDVGGEPVLRPTGLMYFAIDPQPIRVPAGMARGQSEAIAVRSNPVAPSGDPPIRFPEQLLFSATAGSRPARQSRSVVVPVLGVDEVLRP